MAFTTSITCSPAAPTSVIQGQPIHVVLVISNSGGSDGILQFIKPHVYNVGQSEVTSKIPTSAQVKMGTEFVSQTVPAGGSLTVQFDIQIHVPGDFNVDYSTVIQGQTSYRTGSPAEVVVALLP